MTDLASPESLSAARFPTSPASQQRFLEDVVQERCARMELPHSRALAFGAAAALSLAGAVLLLARGDMTGLWAAGGSALLHGLAAAFSSRNQRQRLTSDSEPHPAACYRDPEGTLRLRLYDDEQVLKERDADGRVRARARTVAGVLQASWGIVLGGVPIAAVGGAALGKPGLLLVTAGTFLGTYVFGRGVMTLVSTRPVERVVLTSQRIAVLAAPGVAHSIPLTSLRHRPVVVGRASGRASVAVATRPLPATHPLPLPGLYGLHDVDEDEARAWAGEAVDARRKLLEGPG